MSSTSSEAASPAVLVGQLGDAIRDLDPGRLAHLRRPASPMFEETWLGLAVRVLEPAGGLAPDRDYGAPRERAWRAVAMGIAVAGHEPSPGNSIGRTLAENGFPLGRLRTLLADRNPDPERWTFEVASFLASRRAKPDWALWAAILLAAPARRAELLTQLRRDYLANLAD